MKTWKKDESTGAGLALLLVLVLLGAPAARLPRGDLSNAPCEEALFVEAAGDVARAGVHVFCQRAVTVSDLFQRAAARGAALSRAESADAKRRLPQGARVVFRAGAGGVRPDGIEGMNAFQRMTLGLPVSVNLASREGLTALPGVGPGLSGAMVDFRERNDGFEREEDLLEVRGIGPELLKGLRPHIIVP